MAGDSRRPKPPPVPAPVGRKVQSELPKPLARRPNKFALGELFPKAGEGPQESDRRLARARGEIVRLCEVITQLKTNVQRERRVAQDYRKRYIALLRVLIHVANRLRNVQAAGVSSPVAILNAQTNREAPIVGIVSRLLTFIDEHEKMNKLAKTNRELHDLLVAFLIMDSSAVEEIPVDDE